MSQVILDFHPSIEVPDSVKVLAGTAISLESSWTVRQLGVAIERHATHKGIGLRVCALINPARGNAAPPHEQAVQHFRGGDKVQVLADVRAAPWPEAPVTNGKPRPVGAPVPITIFTGFLGAGKTTVLNHLLRDQRKKKFAVIENEFGAVPIDNELLQNSAMDLAEQVVVMENGCMCCTVRGDLLGAFDQIRQQMEKGSPLDAVLVETTGLADPVPIVRTLRQTPDIARYFQLDGTITLVDTKSILNRLSECAEGVDDQERHKQISFADRILLNKLDLVTSEEAAEVYARIRSYNANAPIISSVKGIVPASELTNLRAFDMESMMEELAEAGHGQGHGHGGGHSHDGHECHEDHGHGHGHDAGGDEDNGHGSGHTAAAGHGVGHNAALRHDNEIGSFSIVRKGAEVEPLAFARWVRIIATLPPELGNLYRSKGVLAAVGKRAKLVFHAVADVTETSDGPDWGEHEQRICKIVFIGKKLNRKEIEERFLQLLQPVKENLRPPLRAASPSFSAKLTLTTLAQRGLLQHSLLGLWTKDMGKVAAVSPVFYDALYSPEGFTTFRSAASTLSKEAPKGLQTVEGNVWLHGLLPMNSIATYSKNYKMCKIKMVTKCSGEYMWGEPMKFLEYGEVEAAGVMWTELAEMEDSDTANFVIEFNWRAETIEQFFSVPGSSTASTLVKITVEDPNDPNDTDLEDELRFRVNLNPEQSEDKSMALHRMSLQLVGGKSSYHVYQIFFHTVDPTYQVHIAVPDHRQPIFPTKEVFHQWHPLMAGLKQQPRLRFLVRLKSMESGPLDAMCGCCG
mmetsp:Transcript_55034/g.141672  ORF Transcript_55034/g.141672 Transcript_55034/m.141672 type:complete len:799 (-) Transcript_55034:367-2763(-)